MISIEAVPPVTAHSEPRARPKVHVPFVMGSLACLFAAGTANDALVGLADGGIRSPTFLVGAAFAASALLALPEVIRTLLRARVLQLFGLTFAIPLIVLVACAAVDGVEISERHLADKPLKLLVMALLLSTVAEDTAWRGRIVVSYVVGWWVFVAVCLGQVAMGRHVTSEHFQVARVSILGLNENAQAITAGSGIVLLAAVALHSGRVRDIAHFLAASIAGGFVFLLGNSRTALVALVVGLLTIALVEFRCTRQRFAAMWTRYARLGVALAVAVSLANVAGERLRMVRAAVTGMQTRIVTAIDGEDRGERDTLAEATLELITNHWFGIGYGRTWDVLGDDPHNDFLKIVAEGGILAGLVLLAAVAALARAAWSGSRVPGEAGYIGALVLFGITGLAGQGLVRPMLWLFIAVVTTAPRYGVRSSRSWAR